MNEENEKINVLVCGLLSTGSSALVDMLSEYDNINAILHEFDDYRAPGLVADQLSSTHNLEFENKIGKLTEFGSKIKLLYDVIIPILTLKLRTTERIKHRIVFSIVRNKELNLLKNLNNKLSSNISSEDKIKFANNWIKEIGNINNRGNKFNLFNQPILSTIDINIWNQVFSPWKLICVYRDPRDQLAEIIKKGFLYAPYGAPKINHGGVLIETIYGRSRKSAISFHIDAIKKRYEWIDKLKNEFNTDKLLLIDFEGLVYKYNAYKTIVENFIGDINSHHKKYKMYFNPYNAEKSVGMYKEYLSNNELELLSDLEVWYKNMIKYNNLTFN